MKQLLAILALISIVLGYPNGITPTNADVLDALAQWERYKAGYISSEGTKNPSTMLRSIRGNGASSSEYHGFAMQYASMLEKDEEVLGKLWNYAKAHLTSHGLMSWEVTASGGTKPLPVADGDMDIGMALDRAALRWGGDWGQAATNYINKSAFHLTNFRNKNTVLAGAINGDGAGHYINYFTFAHFARFDARSTNNKGWNTSVKDKCYQLMEKSYTDYRLPAWYVRKDGTMAKPGDPWGTPGTRWDAGATRVTWRVGTHALVTDDPDAHKWAERIIEVFKENGADENILKVSSGYNPVTGESLNWGAAPTTMAGAGVCGMVTGDQKIVDQAYDFLAKWPIPSEPGRIGNMDDAMAVMGLCIMNGIFSTDQTVPDPTTEIVTPGAPQGVQVNPITSNSMELTWNPVEQAFGYYVERKDGGSYEPLAEVNRNLESYVVTGLDPSTQYEFRIAAHSRAGTSEFATASGTTPAPSSGEVVYAVNCGGPQYTSADGVYFQADENFSSGMNNPRYFDIAGTEDDIVYASERFGSFSYSIPVDNDEYTVSLLFAEAFWTEPGKRIFNAKVEGKSFTGLDLVNEVGTRTALQKKADVTVTDGTVSVSIQTVQDNGTLQGIVVRRPGKTNVRNTGLATPPQTGGAGARRLFTCRGRLLRQTGSTMPHTGVFLSKGAGDATTAVRIGRRLGRQ